MTDWLPPISGFTFGLVLSAILEICKLFGVHEDRIGVATAAFGLIWVFLTYATHFYPVTTPWVEWSIMLILVAASVPLGAKAGYVGIVKPIIQKRWNLEP